MVSDEECIISNNGKDYVDEGNDLRGDDTVLLMVQGSVGEPSGSSTSSGADDVETVGKSNTGSDDNKANIKNTLSSKRDELKLDALRYLVLLMLIIAAVSISVIVYILTSNAETEEFESQYEGIAPKALARLTAIKDFISVANTVGSVMTSQGVYQEKHNLQSWPFVTLSDFHWHGQVVRSLSRALYISVFNIVVEANRDAWEEYVVGVDGDWIEVGLEYQKELGLTDFERQPPTLDDVLMGNMTSKPIFYFDENGVSIVDNKPGPYLPKWQTSPVLLNDDINSNLYRVEEHFEMVEDTSTVGFLEFSNFVFGLADGHRHNSNSTGLLETLLSFAQKEDATYSGGPVMYSYLPIYDSFDQESKTIVGLVQSILMWELYFQDILPPNQRGIILVLENTCNGFFTYELIGPDVNVLGRGDLHDTKFNKYEFVDFFGTYDKNITDGSKEGLIIDRDSCIYKLHVYPSQTYVDAYKTNTPMLMTFAVAMVFALALVLFLLFNTIVERRQRMILDKAVQTTAIVSSLFPKQVRDRLLEQDNEQDPNNGGRRSAIAGSSHAWSSLVGTKEAGSRQIADLFPNCTVLFADIVGFTAWSSTRGPEHVFVLLQTLYHGFDQVAKRRNVFKVETIGDCYLAATGLPEPQPTHAVIMARFAYDCLVKMSELMSELDISLGPDCSDLKMRFGMNSGPVTAGVLRGERARFQLFGDTVNTAARMESTGLPGKIQISESTADLLHSHGKGHWIKPREEKVEAKGKGVVSTFWLNPNLPKYASTSLSSGQESSERVCDHLEPSLNGPDVGRSSLKIAKDMVKERRMVDWMVELLMMHIRKMLVERNQSEKTTDQLSLVASEPKIDKNYLEEVMEVIPMSKFDSVVTRSDEDEEREQELDEELVACLREYVTITANMYNSNPFHNFEHACHVTMSVSKLLTRIVSPVLTADGCDQESKLHLHERTYGISSDPLAQFAIVFSALIHDVGHRGCSNEQLIKEDMCMAKLYRCKSVAEQNSLDLAWGLLMSSQFDRLRNVIFSGHDDLSRFRQVIVNSVMATDIFDKEFNNLRKVRWERAFAPHAGDDVDHMDRKATIVIEHIIQASDVSHTMQHWHIYRKWNKQLFKEMYTAYLDGRMVVDPSTFWYQGELSFFDNYVIPLAKKLEECNVFGVSSDECLNYAVGNRKEWEQKGESIVAENLREINGNGDVE